MADIMGKGGINDIFDDDAVESLLKEVLSTAKKTVDKTLKVNFEIKGLKEGTEEFKKFSEMALQWSQSMGISQDKAMEQMKNLAEIMASFNNKGGKYNFANTKGYYGSLDDIKKSILEQYKDMEDTKKRSGSSTESQFKEMYRLMNAYMTKSAVEGGYDVDKDYAKALQQLNNLQGVAQDTMEKLRAVFATTRGKSGDSSWKGEPGIKSYMESFTYLAGIEQKKMAGAIRGLGGRLKVNTSDYSGQAMPSFFDVDKVKEDVTEAIGSVEDLVKRIDKIRGQRYLASDLIEIDEDGIKKKCKELEDYLDAQLQSVLNKSDGKVKLRPAESLKNSEQLGRNIAGRDLFRNYYRLRALDSDRADRFSDIFGELSKNEVYFGTTYAEELFSGDGGIKAYLANLEQQVSDEINAMAKRLDLNQLLFGQLEAPKGTGFYNAIEKYVTDLTEKMAKELQDKAGKAFKYMQDNNLLRLGTEEPRQESRGGFMFGGGGGGMSPEEVERLNAALEKLTVLFNELNQKITEFGTALDSDKLNGLITSLNESISKLPQVIDAQALEHLKGVVDNLGELHDKLKDGFNVPSNGGDLTEYFKDLEEKTKTINENIGNITKSLTELGGIFTTDKTALSGLDVGQINAINGAFSELKETISDIHTLLKDNLNLNPNQIRDFVGNMTNLVNNTSDPKKVQEKGTKIVQEAQQTPPPSTTPIKTEKSTTNVSNSVNTLSQMVAEVNSKIRELGTMAAEGYEGAIRKGTPGAVNAAGDMVESVLERVRDVQDSHSPSKKTEKLGINFVEGFIIGIKESKGEVVKAINDTFSLEEMHIDFANMLNGESGKQIAEQFKKVLIDASTEPGESINPAYFDKIVNPYLKRLRTGDYHDEEQMLKFYNAIGKTVPAKNVKMVIPESAWENASKPFANMEKSLEENKDKISAVLEGLLGEYQEFYEKLTGVLQEIGNVSSNWGGGSSLEDVVQKAFELNLSEPKKSGKWTEGAKKFQEYVSMLLKVGKDDTYDRTSIGGAAGQTFNYADAQNELFSLFGNERSSINNAVPKKVLDQVKKRVANVAKELESHLTDELRNAGITDISKLLEMAGSGESVDMTGFLDKFLPQDKIQEKIRTQLQGVVPNDLGKMLAELIYNSLTNNQNGVSENGLSGFTQMIVGNLQAQLKEKVVAEVSAAQSTTTPTTTKATESVEDKKIDPELANLGKALKNVGTGAIQSLIKIIEVVNSKFEEAYKDFASNKSLFTWNNYKDADYRKNLVNEQFPGLFSKDTAESKPALASFREYVTQLTDSAIKNTQFVSKSGETGGQKEAMQEIFSLFNDGTLEKYLTKAMKEKVLKVKEQFVNGFVQGMDGFDFEDKVDQANYNLQKAMTASGGLKDWFSRFAEDSIFGAFEDYLTEDQMRKLVEVIVGKLPNTGFKGGLNSKNIATDTVNDALEAAKTSNRPTKIAKLKKAMEAQMTSNGMKVDQTFLGKYLEMAEDETQELKAIFDQFMADLEERKKAIENSNFMEAFNKLAIEKEKLSKELNGLLDAGIEEKKEPEYYKNLLKIIQENETAFKNLQDRVNNLKLPKGATDEMKANLETLKNSLANNNTKSLEVMDFKNNIIGAARRSRETEEQEQARIAVENKRNQLKSMMESNKDFKQSTLGEDFLKAYLDQVTKESDDINKIYDKFIIDLKAKLDEINRINEEKKKQQQDSAMPEYEKKMAETQYLSGSLQGQMDAAGEGVVSDTINMDNLYKMIELMQSINGMSDIFGIEASDSKWLSEVSGKIQEIVANIEKLTTARKSKKNLGEVLKLDQSLSQEVTNLIDLANSFVEVFGEQFDSTLIPKAKELAETIKFALSGGADIDEMFTKISATFGKGSQYSESEMRGISKGLELIYSKENKEGAVPGKLDDHLAYLNQFIENVRNMDLSALEKSLSSSKKLGSNMLAAMTGMPVNNAQARSEALRSINPDLYDKNLEEANRLKAEAKKQEETARAQAATNRSQSATSSAQASTQPSTTPAQPQPSQPQQPPQPSQPTTPPPSSTPTTTGQGISDGETIHVILEPKWNQDELDKLLAQVKNIPITLSQESIIAVRNNLQAYVSNNPIVVPVKPKTDTIKTDLETLINNLNNDPTKIFLAPDTTDALKQKFIDAIQAYSNNHPIYINIDVADAKMAEVRQKILSNDNPAVIMTTIGYNVDDLNRKQTDIVNTISPITIQAYVPQEQINGVMKQLSQIPQNKQITVSIINEEQKRAEFNEAILNRAKEELNKLNKITEGVVSQQDAVLSGSDADKQGFLSVIKDANDGLESLKSTLLSIPGASDTIAKINEDLATLSNVAANVNSANVTPVEEEPPKFVVFEAFKAELTEANAAMAKFREDLADIVNVPLSEGNENILTKISEILGSEGEGTVRGVISKIQREIKALSDTLANIPSAVEAKTKAFGKEKNDVTKFIESENRALGELEKRVAAVATATNGSLTNEVRKSFAQAVHVFEKTGDIEDFKKMINQINNDNLKDMVKAQDFGLERWTYIDKTRKADTVEEIARQIQTTRAPSNDLVTNINKQYEVFNRIIQNIRDAIKDIESTLGNFNSTDLQTFGEELGKLEEQLQGHLIQDLNENNILRVIDSILAKKDALANFAKVLASTMDKIKKTADEIKSTDPTEKKEDRTQADFNRRYASSQQSYKDGISQVIIAQEDWNEAVKSGRGTLEEYEKEIGEVLKITERLRLEMQKDEQGNDLGYEWVVGDRTVYGKKGTIHEQRMVDEKGKYLGYATDPIDTTPVNKHFELQRNTKNADLDKYLQDLRDAGVLTDELEQKIEAFRTQLNNISPHEGLAGYTESVKTLKDEVTKALQGARKQLSEDKQEYKDQINVIKEFLAVREEYNRLSAKNIKNPGGAADENLQKIADYYKDLRDKYNKALITIVSLNNKGVIGNREMAYFNELITPQDTYDAANGETYMGSFASIRAIRDSDAAKDAAETKKALEDGKKEYDRQLEVIKKIVSARDNYNKLVAKNIKDSTKITDKDVQEAKEYYEELAKGYQEAKEVIDSLRSEGIISEEEQRKATEIYTPQATYTRENGETYSGSSEAIRDIKNSLAVNEVQDAEEGYKKYIKVVKDVITARSDLNDLAAEEIRKGEASVINRKTEALEREKNAVVALEDALKGIESLRNSGMIDDFSELDTLLASSDLQNGSLTSRDNKYKAALSQIEKAKSKVDAYERAVQSTESTREALSSGGSVMGSLKRNITSMERLKKKADEAIEAIDELNKRFEGDKQYEERIQAPIVETLKNRLSSIEMRADASLDEGQGVGFENAVRGYKTLSKNAVKYYSILAKQDTGSITINDQAFLNNMQDYYQQAAYGVESFSTALGKATASEQELAKAAETFGEDKIQAMKTVTEKMVDDIDVMISKIGQTPEELMTDRIREDLEKSKQSIAEINEMLIGLSTDESDAAYTGLRWADINEADFKNIAKQISTLKRDVGNLGTGDDYKVVNEFQKAQLSRQMSEWAMNNKAAYEQVERIEAMQDALKNVNDQGALNQMRADFESVKQKAYDAGIAGRTFGEQLTGSFKNLSRYLMSFASFYRIVSVIKQSVGIVKELDTSMTNLRKVVDDTDGSFKRFEKSAFSIAKSLGSTATAVIDAATEWGRLGYNLDQSAELSKASLIYANVGEMDAGTATNDLVSILKAFGIDTNNVMNVVDVLNEIG